MFEVRLAVFAAYIYVIPQPVMISPPVISLLHFEDGDKEAEEVDAVSEETPLEDLADPSVQE